MSHYKIDETIRHIEEQATRHKGDPSPELMKADLLIIEQKALLLRGLLPKCVTPNGRTDGCSTYIKIEKRDGENVTVCSFCGRDSDECTPGGRLR